MGKVTGIEWTDSTWNPVVGCTKVSPGCDNCYAEALFRRWNGSGFEKLRLSSSNVMALPLFLKASSRVFVCSMSDFFHRDAARYWPGMTRVMLQRPDITFQMLTKRPGQAVEYWKRMARLFGWTQWPAHMWLGVSAENQKYLPRIDVIKRVPAPVHFLSAEPLLGPLDLCGTEAMDWVIIGGESGPKARPMDLDWAVDIVSQCREAGVPVFVKQLGTVAAKRLGMKSYRGGDIEEFPPELRVREFPTT